MKWSFKGTPEALHDKQGLHWLRIGCSQQISQIEKVGAKCQGFSQKVVSSSYFVFFKLCPLGATFLATSDWNMGKIRVRYQKVRYWYIYRI